MLSQAAALSRQGYLEQPKGFIYQNNLNLEFKYINKTKIIIACLNENKPLQMKS